MEAKHACSVCGKLYCHDEEDCEMSDKYVLFDAPSDLVYADGVWIPKSDLEYAHFFLTRGSAEKKMYDERRRQKEVVATAFGGC